MVTFASKIRRFATIIDERKTPWSQKSESKAKAENPTAPVPEVTTTTTTTTTTVIHGKDCRY